MIPDLGRYALEVSLAYAGSITALLVIVGLSVLRARRVRDALDQAEHRWKKHGE